MIHPEKRRANIAQIEIYNKIKDCIYNNGGHCDLYVMQYNAMQRPMNTECDAEVEGDEIKCYCYISKKEAHHEK